ncbi:MAG: hypothetical protein K0S65_453 [Labilithrix sp.]|nr:hypothetical protein [Labilithrix sp.]
MAKPKTTKSSSPSSTESLASLLATLAPAKKLPTALAGYSFPDLEGPGGPLGVDVKTALLGALVAGALGKKPHVELARASITPESRDQFALALLRFWEEKEFHGRYEWVLDGVTALGGDGSIIALAGHIAAWPAQSDTGRKRAIEAIPALLGTRTDTALLALCGLRQTAVVPSVLEAIIDTLDKAVEKRGTTLSELFDVITPTLGLDARGMRSFDYGARRFTVAFDDHFVPRLRDEAGHTLEELPEPEPGDDVARASAARALWSTLSAQLREAVKVQTFRLEQDMIGGRRWDTKGWLRHLHEHPLLVSFTRRLVWGLYDEDDVLISAFRTAEDHSLVGLDDVEVKLPPKARIGVVHPQHLDEKSRAAWADHFADYEIIQPFAQLGRALNATSEQERTGATSARFAETRFKSGVLRDVLVRKGWERDRAFFRQFYQRTFLGDRVVAIATMSPGVSAGSASYTVADQTIATIEFRKRTGRGKSSEPMPLADVPRVAFSEAVLDLSDVLVEQDASDGTTQG